MAGEILSHSRVCINSARKVDNKLKGKACEALSPNMKVGTLTASLFPYPDLTIVGGESVFHDTKKDVSVNPKVIFEVLSPSAENYDRTTKFQKYRLGNETLTDYILIAQDEVFVEHFAKQSNGEWIYRSCNDIDDRLRLDSAECESELREIYDRVEISPEIEEEYEEV